MRTYESRVQLLNYFQFTSRSSSSVESLALTSSMPPSSSSWSIACTSSGHDRRNSPDETLCPHGSNANACGNPCRQWGDTPTDAPALCRSWRSSMQRRSPSVAGIGVYASTRAVALVFAPGVSSSVLHATCLFAEITSGMGWGVERQAKERVKGLG